MNDTTVYKGVDVNNQGLAQVKHIDSIVNASFNTWVQVGRMFQGSMNVADTFYARNTVEWSLFERLYALKLQGAAVYVNQLGFISSVR